MNAESRRSAILSRLAASDAPMSATALAGEFSVSRQIIVGDIALLRAAGETISATPRGYVLQKERAGLVKAVAVVHTQGQTEEELYIMVDNGCAVLDVIVEHPVYGQLTGALQLASRYDVQQFIRRADAAQPLSLLTEGVHLHTLSCPGEDAFARVVEELDRAGFLLRREE